MRLRNFTVLCSMLFAIGCDAPGTSVAPHRGAATCSGLCSNSLDSGTYVSSDDQIAYQAYTQDGVSVFNIVDATSGAVLVSSQVTSESAGSVTFAGAQPFDGSATPSDSDFDLIDQFAAAHGTSAAGLVLLLDWQNVVDPMNPTQVAEYAAAVQIVQVLQLYQMDDVTIDLQALAVSLGTGYFNQAIEHTGALAFGNITNGSETVPMTFPFVGTYNFLGDGSQLGAVGPPEAQQAQRAAQANQQAGAIPNQWLCDGTPYKAGCRHMCGASCNAATTSSSIRCTDGILWRDTYYTGTTNVCCAQHDDGYDACSARYNCGVGNCRRIVVPIPRRPFFRVIQISCATMIEICRRVPDAGCVACALLNGYQATDCLLWIIGLGPGVPITFVDTTRIGNCCPRCGAGRMSLPGAYSQPFDVSDDADGGCVCDTPDGGDDAGESPSPSPSPSDSPSPSPSPSDSPSPSPSDSPSPSPSPSDSPSPSPSDSPSPSPSPSPSNWPSPSPSASPLPSPSASASPF